MARNANYEYVNKANIDSELICTICNDPFNDPLCTPCDHTFCRDCITRWIGDRNRTCPVCNQHLTSVNDLVPANRIVRNMLDRLPVKCIFCAKTGLQRSDFNDHTTKACSKVHVPCPSADIKCPWNGTRDQLDDHVTTCVFQPFRTILTELITKNLQIEEKINQQNTTMKQQDAQMKQQDAQIKQQDAQIKQQDAQMKQQDAQIKQQDAQIKQQDAQMKQQDAQIKQQDAKMKQQDVQIKQQDAQMKQQDAQTKASIDQLSSKFSLLLPTVIPQ